MHNAVLVRAAQGGAHLFQNRQHLGLRQTPFLRQQLSQLLADINNHQNDSTDAHDASAISVADSAGNLSANDVESALAEILDAFEDDHYRGNQANAGQHRTIHQPDFGSGRVLLWDARGVGSSFTRLRVYMDIHYVWSL